MRLPTLSPRFMRFALVGASGTAIDFALFYLFYSLLGLPLVLANTLSYGTGLTSSFFLNRRYTFADSPKQDSRRVWLSLLFGYIGLAINTALVWGIEQVAHVWVGKVAAVFVVLVYNYLMNKWFVFGLTHKGSDA